MFFVSPISMVQMISLLILHSLSSLLLAIGAHRLDLLFLFVNCNTSSC